MFKKILIVLFSLGLVFTIVGLILAKGNLVAVIYSFVDDAEYEFVEKEGADIITQIELDLSSSNVVFHHYDGTGYKVDYYESKNDTKTFEVKDGLLKLSSQREWYKGFFFTFSFSTSKVDAVNVYIPSSFDGPVNIKITSGRLNLKDYDLTSLNVGLTSGNILIENVNVTNNVVIKNTSGNVTLNSFTANDLSINLTSGDLKLENVTVTENTNISSTSGSVSAKSSSLKKIDANLTSGNFRILDCYSDQIGVKITSGNITIRIYGNPDDYTINPKKTSGSIYFQDNQVGSYVINAGKDKFINATCTSGNIKINIATP